MELFNTILDNINIVLTTIIGIAFTSQLIYTILFFVPTKKFKKAKTTHKVGVVICARNEENVIENTIKCLKEQDYPQDMFDIYVVAHNCTDNTASIASRAGAIVLEHNDDEPSHKRVSYALKHLFEHILSNNIKYDFYVRFDADNLVDKNYLSKMNDAYDAGVKVARGYNNAKNLTDNVISGISGLWYIRDARFACQARSFLGTHQMLLGPGMMFAHEIIEKNGGWNAMGITEDAEFAMDCLFKGYKAQYVSEAICYDDQPTTGKDCFNRFTRIGNGLHSLFYTHGIKSFFLFFRHWNWGYLDMFLTLLFIPIAVLCCVWLPFYYGYVLIYNSVIGNMDLFYLILNNIGYALIGAFIIPFILQAILVYFLDKKKINQPFKKVLPSILLFPLFMIIYAFSIFIGVISKPKWRQINRSKAVTLSDIGVNTAVAGSVAYVTNVEEDKSKDIIEDNNSKENKTEQDKPNKEVVNAKKTKQPKKTKSK